MEVPFEKRAMAKEPTVKSGSLMHGQEPVDPYMEKRVVRKCDFHVLPVLSVLYMVAFLDRVNIGNVSVILSYLPGLTHETYRRESKALRRT